CPEVDARSLAESLAGPLDVREDVIGRSALERSARLGAPNHECGGVNTWALAPVSGGKAMVRRGGIDERRRDECHSTLEINIVLLNGYCIAVIKPRYTSRYRPVFRIRVWPRHILPGPEPVSAEHFI